MKILFIHNRYKNRGGEDTVFEQEVNLLKKAGNQVETIEFNNNIIGSALSQFLFFFKSIYNPGSASIVRRKIQEFSPEVIHVHNFYYVASPSIFNVAKKKIPTIHTLHNFRMICSAATLLRDN